MSQTAALLVPGNLINSGSQAFLLPVLLPALGIGTDSP